MAIFEELFDRVVVVSLPSSIDRREHIRAHFQEIGLGHYEFHDAFGSEHPEVLALYGDGLVALYPPCFRCGKMDCGKADCNNVLTPQQVAVFATYLNLWRHLSEGNERVLVCEDDVFFHPWTERVLLELVEKIRSAEIAFSGDVPALLRFGWALGKDHDGALPFRAVRDVRMSNPCHAITGAYARALLAEFNGVRHTADVFQHSLALASKGNALTILPPIASELSWSVGVFKSLIHPKENHARHLEHMGRFDEASRYRQIISMHFRDIAHKKPS